MALMVQREQSRDGRVEPTKIRIRIFSVKAALKKI